MKYKIAYDCELMQPGCVLLQAALGGTVPNFAALFDAKMWILAPTPALKLYEVDDAQLKQLVEMSKTRESSEGQKRRGTR